MGTLLLKVCYCITLCISVTDEQFSTTYFDFNPLQIWLFFEVPTSWPVSEHMVWVRNVVLMSVYLGLGNPRGSGFRVGGQVGR